MVSIIVQEMCQGSPISPPPSVAAITKYLSSCKRTMTFFQGKTSPFDFTSTMACLALYKGMTAPVQSDIMSLKRPG